MAHDLGILGRPELRLTKRQETILVALARDAPELAKVYEGGVRLLLDEYFPGRVYFLGHALREIRNRLPNYYGIPTAERVRYDRVVEQLNGRWQAEVRPQLQTSQTTPGLTERGIYVPIELVTELDALLREHDESAGKRREAHIRFLASRDMPGVTSYPEPVIRQWLDLPWDQFTHVRVPSAEPPSIDRCVKSWQVLEDVLYAIVAPMHESTGELDELLLEANRRTD